jgi:hypothetical protein
VLLSADVFLAAQRARTVDRYFLRQRHVLDLRKLGSQDVAIRIAVAKHLLKPRVLFRLAQVPLQLEFPFLHHINKTDFLTFRVD